MYYEVVGSRHVGEMQSEGAAIDAIKLGLDPVMPPAAGLAVTHSDLWARDVPFKCLCNARYISSECCGFSSSMAGSARMRLEQ